MTPASSGLPLRTLAGYGALAAPLQMMVIPLIAFLPTFYAADLGLGLATVGIVFMLARLWDGITDIVVGSLSDRTRTRFGRRRPWILAGLPPLVVAIYFLLMPSPPVDVAYLVVWVAVFYPLWTMVFIPYQSLGAEIATSYIERSRVATWRETGTVVGVLIALGVPAFVLPRDVELARILELIGVMAIVLFPLGGALLMMGVREPNNPPVPTVAWRNLWPILRRNAPFRRLLLAYFVSMLGLGMFVSTAFLLLSRSLLLGAAFLILGFWQHVAALTSMPFWMRLARRYPKHRIYACANLLIAAGILTLYFTPPGNYYQALAGFLLMGVGNLPNFAMPGALLADTIDYFTWKAGVEQTGQHTAIKSIVHKLSQTFSVGAAFLLLAAGGYNAEAENQPEAVEWLSVVATWPAVALMIGAAALMWWYPLDSRRHGILRRRIERRALSQQHPGVGVTTA